MVIDEITQINDKLELCCVFSKTVCKSPAAGGRESVELRAETAGREVWDDGGRGGSGEFL